MSFYLGRLFLVLFGSVLIGWLGSRLAHGWHQRLMLCGMLVGLFTYSGIGSAMHGVRPEFVYFYFVFAIAIVVGFHFSRQMFFPMSRYIGIRVPCALPDVDRRPQWKRIVLAYFILSAFPLIWPEFRVLELLRPGRPDIVAGFFLHFDEAPDTLLKIVGYGKLMLAPFFFIALYRLRLRLRWVIVIFCALSYIQYIVAFNYIGRSLVMMYLVILFLSTWILKPATRTRLVVGIICFVPVFFVGSYVYTVIRMGRILENFGFFDAVQATLDVELGLVRDVGMVIYETGSRVDMARYVRWIVTLPLPKVLTGPFDVTRINYDISEIVLGVPTGSSGWYVVLPGLVSEAIYLYGKNFFWIHALLLGGFAAFFVRLMERVPQFLFLFLYVVVLFSYNVNRAGISGLLPMVTNEFLLLYLYLFAMMSRPSSSRVVL